MAVPRNCFKTVTSGGGTYLSPKYFAAHFERVFGSVTAYLWGRERGDTLSRYEGCHNNVPCFDSNKLILCRIARVMNSRVICRWEEQIAEVGTTVERRQVNYESIRALVKQSNYVHRVAGLHSHGVDPFLARGSVGVGAPQAQVIQRPADGSGHSMASH